MKSSFDKKTKLTRAIATLFVIACLILVFHKKLGLVSVHQPQIHDFVVDEVGQAAGINFVHEQTPLSHYKNIEPWLSSLSSSVSVVDIDNDGWPDIYLNTGVVDKPNKLFRNNHDGTFTDVAEKYGLADLNKKTFSVRSVFFDCDNDGVPELLLTKAGYASLYKKNKRGLYEEIPFLNDSDVGLYSNAVNVLDINRDGLLDIIIPVTVGRGEGRIDALPMNFVHSVNGAPTLVYENKGSCHFVKNNDWLKEKTNAFTNALGAGDLTNQNKADLWFGTDYNDDQVFLQKNDSSGYDRFPEVKKYTAAKNGMSSEFGYLDSEYPYVFVSQVFKSNFLPYGNTLWRYDGKTFVDFGREFGVRACGWAWGAKFIDLNNSGNQSLYVTNGFVRGDEKKQYWFFLTVLSSAPQGIVSSAKYWPDMNGFDIAGHEKDCLFVNEGNNKFYDYASDPAFHIDEENSLGRGVATVDYLNNGSQALLVSNQKGRPYLYRVTHKNNNHWIGFKLIGKKSNRDAIGAKLELIVGGAKKIREIYPLNGFSSQSDIRAHFGLAEFDKVDSLKIIWPSGVIQNVQIQDIKIDQYNTIEERVEN